MKNYENITESRKALIKVENKLKMNLQESRKLSESHKPPSLSIFEMSFASSRLPYVKKGNPGVPFKIEGILCRTVECLAWMDGCSVKTDQYLPWMDKCSTKTDQYLPRMDKCSTRTQQYLFWINKYLAKMDQY